MGPSAVKTDATGSLLGGKADLPTLRHFDSLSISCVLNSCTHKENKTPQSLRSWLKPKSLFVSCFLKYIFPLNLQFYVASAWHPPKGTVSWSKQASAPLSLSWGSQLVAAKGSLPEASAGPGG